MIIWADADSLPSGVRELCGRRNGTALHGEERIEVCFVAARQIPLPAGNSGNLTIVAPPETADEYILASARPGDLVVTRDIPLAAKVLALGANAINDRGEVWSADSIRERLSIRDRMEELRKSGLAVMPKSTGFGPGELKAFANALEKSLQACRKELVRRSSRS